MTQVVLYKHDPEELILYSQTFNDDPDLAKICKDLDIYIPVSDKEKEKENDNQVKTSDKTVDLNDPHGLIIVLCYEFSRFIYHDYWKTQNKEFSLFSDNQPPSGILHLRSIIAKEAISTTNSGSAQQLLFKLKEAARKNLESISLLRTKSTTWLYEILAGLDCIIASDINKLDSTQLLYSLNKKHHIFCC